MVERLDRLRHDTVICCDHEDRDVGGLGTTGTHGGERLVTGGVDEGDSTLFTIDGRRHLVGTDVLGDATGFLVAHIRIAKGVQEPGLTVVDVTHDGDDRRAEGEVALVALVGAEVDVEALEQLTILLLRRDHLDDVVQLLTKQVERLVVDRLGGGDHLAQGEQQLHQGGCVEVDPLSEVGQGRAAWQANGLAVTLADADAADRRDVHIEAGEGQPRTALEHGEQHGQAARVEPLGRAAGHRRARRRSGRVLRLRVLQVDAGEALAKRLHLVGHELAAVRGLGEVVRRREEEAFEVRLAPRGRTPRSRGSRSRAR